MTEDIASSIRKSLDEITDQTLLFQNLALALGHPFTTPAKLEETGKMLFYKEVINRDKPTGITTIPEYQEIIRYILYVYTRR